MARYDPYAAGNKWIGPYPHRTEIDLRQEFNNMLDGVYPEISKAQYYLLRKFRRNARGERILCQCTDVVTHEPDRDIFCPICHGDGFYWDEHLIQVYRKSTVGDTSGALQDTMKSAGITNVDLYTFWFKSRLPVTQEDKIVRVALDEEGFIVDPVYRTELWRIGMLLDLRSDNGRLEFWQAHCYAEKRTFLNGPDTARINR